MTTILSLYIATISLIGGFYKNSDLKSLTDNFSESIIITYGDIEIEGRDECIVFMKEFYRKNKVTDYKTIHLGKSPVGNKFEIGDIFTKTKIIRTTTIFMGNKIIEIKFDEESN